MRLLPLNTASCLSKGVPMVFHWGQDRRAEGRERGWRSWRGSMPLPHQLASMEERWAPQRGSGQSPDRPKVFHYFQHLGMDVAYPDTIVLLNADYHSATGGQDHRVSLCIRFCVYRFAQLHWMQMWISYRSLLANCCHFSNGVAVLSVIYIIISVVQKSKSLYKSMCVNILELIVNNVRVTTPKEVCNHLTVIFVQ